MDNGLISQCEINERGSLMLPSQQSALRAACADFCPRGLGVPNPIPKTQFYYQLW